VVIAIITVLTAFSAASYMKMSRSQNFESALSNIYSNIDNKKLETVVSGNKKSIIYFNKKFERFYYNYTENRFDETDAVLIVNS